MKNETTETQKHYPRLKKFAFKNWKSFKEGVIWFDDLTVLTGHNGAGKTNALEAMEFAIRAICLERTRYAQYEKNIAYWVTAYQDHHLRLSNVLLDNSIGFAEFEFVVEVGETTDFLYRFRLYPDNRCDNAIKKEYAYIIINSTAANELSITRVGNRNGAQMIKRVVKEVVEVFINYEVKPDVLNRSCMECSPLARDFSNFASWLYPRLASLPFDKIKEFAKDVLSLQAIDFVFIERPAKNKAEEYILGGAINDLYSKEIIGDKELLTREIHWSNGMIAVFCILAAVLTAAPGAIIAFENIDAFIHPSCVKRLIKIIENEAQERQFTVLLTTHSVALLDALPLGFTTYLQVVYRNTETNCSEIEFLGNLEVLTELLARGSVGDNISSGLVDKCFRAQSKK